MIMWKGNEITPEIISASRRICHTYCRAKFCEDRGRCLNIWPGPGGFLHIYFDDAIKLINAKKEVAAE
jgi:hypothetical protein